MTVYEGMVHCRLGGPTMGAFKHGSNWYGTLQIDGEGRCIASKADGTPYAQAPASQVRYQQLVNKAGNTRVGDGTLPALVLDFPDGESVTVDFAQGKMKQESPLKRVADVVTMSAMKVGWAERDRFLDALESNGGVGAGPHNVY
jgi:hypothetical protein